MTASGLATRLRVGVGQWRPPPGAVAANEAAALDLAARAGAAGCDVLLLPELWPCGYDAARLAEDVRRAAEPLDGPRVRLLADAARRHGLWFAAGSVPEREHDRCFNTALLLSPDGELVASHRKHHRYAPGGELEAFEGGDELTVCDTGGPLGVVGLTVCFDGDFPETARALRGAGARLVLQPAAYEHGAEHWWERLYPGHALANGQWWVLANQAGGSAEAGCFGRSRVISPLGDVIAEAPRAIPGHDPEPHLLVAEIDFAGALRAAAEEAGALWADRPAQTPVRVLRAGQPAAR